MADHPRSAFRGLISVLKPQVRRINSSGDIAINRFLGFWLETAYSRHFLGSFWGIFSPYDVIQRPDPQKDRPCRKHVVWAIQRKNLCTGSTWAQDREKKGQDNKKVISVIFPVWGKPPVPTGPIRRKSCMVGAVHDVITSAKFQIEIFMGYNVRGGDGEFSIFLFIIACALQQCLW